MSILQARARDWVAITAIILGTAGPAAAQLRSSPYVSGVTNPVAFVQDPSNASVQYVVEQAGVIRVVQNGSLLSTPFVNLSTQISSGGERGLLGLAFPSNYGTSGRFYVCFTNPAGHIVVARMRRSPSNPLLSDGSRFDFLWPGGQRYIFHPQSNHNGGNIAFGPDGYLYVGMGDGGGANDPDHLAQNPGSLLGKMLRIDVSVADGDAEGYNVPPSNPFIAQPGYLPEIWSFGLRNPWRWSFDDPTLGGSGALVIGDVGQGAREEIDYEPSGVGGRNYGWRNREGAQDSGITPVLPPAFLPLTDPIFDYPRSSGQSITGGFVYRGSALSAAYRGRYFFADFVARRVWSIALDFSRGGDPIAVGLIDHTAELGGSAALGGITSFGVDASGELYLASFNGSILKILPGVRTPNPILTIDTPANGAVVRQPFMIAGWSIDTNAAAGTGMGTHHVWAFPSSGAAPRFVGTTTAGTRPDVASIFGPQFAESGYGLFASGLPPGGYRLMVFGWVNAAANFTVVQTVDVTVTGSTILVLDTPTDNATVTRPFLLAGWAIDPSAPSGVGINTVHIWAFPVNGGPPTFVGVPALGGSRPDVGGYFGSRFTPSGYNILVTLPPGTYDLGIYANSAVTNSFDAWQVRRVMVQ